ncbi:PQQ-binding-like beta-propeller repeat protein [Armatimonas sp.]|uniref:outer membrane protein assembly factor BamB family protein n=1 Tax=Armatimonas sp. TaxID=1872638 RepID=UPI0037537286
MKRNALLATSLLALSMAAALTVKAADWPFWGGGASRNMVSSEKNIAVTWDPGRYKGSTEEIDLATTKNVKWVAKLGSQSYGNPTVSGGKIFVGTNNESPRDEKLKGDRAVLLCLDEKTGEMIWQLAVPKLGTGKVSDWEFLGLCSSPAVDGDKVYVVTNRCEVICLDVNGQANGNQGVQDEAKYLTDKGKPLHTLGAKDADVLWRYDMREELGVFPHNITNCGPLILGNTITVTTSNGVDWTHTNIPNPKAPALCVLDKNTGKYLGEEGNGVSAKTMHSNWSSPAGGLVNGKETIIFGGGDGICYAFDPASAVGGEQSILKTLWKLDCNPPEYRMKNGKPLKYATFDGPSEVIATPVLYKNRVYVPIGQDPEHGEGIGQIACIDAVTGKTVWVNKSIHRSLSTPSIINGMVFVSDYSGFVHCFDSETGKLYWSFDSKSHIWGSTMVAEGKVYAGTEDGDIVILAASKVMKELGRVDMRAPIYASPVIANGTLYVGTPTHLYAIATGAKAAQAAPRQSPTALARMTARAKQLRAEHEKLASCEAHGTP